MITPCDHRSHRTTTTLKTTNGTKIKESNGLQERSTNGMKINKWNEDQRIRDLGWVHGLRFDERHALLKMRVYSMFINIE
jgi:hypothetical protein